MKIPPHNRSAVSRSRRRRGSSVLVILVLMAFLVMWIASNTSTLHVLKQELKRIDRQQQKKFSPTAPR